MIEVMARYSGGEKIAFKRIVVPAPFVPKDRMHAYQDLIEIGRDFLHLDQVAEFDAELIWRDKAKTSSLYHSDVFTIGMARELARELAVPVQTTYFSLAGNVGQPLIDDVDAHCQILENRIWNSTVPEENRLALKEQLVGLRSLDRKLVARLKSPLPLDAYMLDGGVIRLYIPKKE